MMILKSNMSVVIKAGPYGVCWRRVLWWLCAPGLVEWAEDILRRIRTGTVGAQWRERATYRYCREVILLRERGWVVVKWKPV